MITVDTSEFRAALREYQQVTGKDIAEVLNRQIKNLIIHAWQQTRLGSAAAIRALEQRPWWPKLIAKYAQRIAARKVARRIARFNAGQYKRQAKASSFEVGGYTVEQARRLSEKFIRRRLNAIGFTRAIVAEALAAVGGSARGKRFRGIVASAVMATDAKPSVSVESAYGYKMRRRDVAPTRILEDALSAAIPATTEDIRQYIAAKLAQRAAAISARRR